MKIITLPAFNDNYIWLFQSEQDSKAYVVDPGDAQVVEQALTEYGLELAGILITHHHLDHTGGVEALTKGRNIPIYGGNHSSVASLTHKLQEGQFVELGNGLSFEVIDVPGHTLDHIAFYNKDQNVLFCGDTLFVAGCGRLFEGTAEQMRHSLNKLANLPRETKIYCAHEYTQANLDFAAAVEPENTDIHLKIDQVRQLRASNKPSVPSTIGAELATNPFLRSTQKSVQNQALVREAANHLNPDEVFASIRQWKDNF